MEGDPFRQERQQVRHTSPLDPGRAALFAAEAALSRKALDVRVLDLRGIASFADYFVICTGTSDTHMEGIASAVIEKMDEINQYLWHREGEREADWILLDYVDVIVHIFTRAARNFYELERLWADAAVVPVDESAVLVDPAWANFDVEAEEEREFIEFTAEDDEWDTPWEEE